MPEVIQQILPLNTDLSNIVKNTTNKSGHTKKRNIARETCMCL